MAEEAEAGAQAVRRRRGRAGAGGVNLTAGNLTAIAIANRYVSVNETRFALDEVEGDSKGIHPGRWMDGNGKWMDLTWIDAVYSTNGSVIWNETERASDVLRLSG